jgi:hypothetical protein
MRGPLAENEGSIARTSRQMRMLVASSIQDVDSHRERADKIAADLRLALEQAHPDASVFVRVTQQGGALIGVELGPGRGLFVEVDSRLANVRVLDPWDHDVTEDELRGYVLARASGQPGLDGTP